MFDSALIDVVIGLIFVFFVFSLLVSGMNELVRKALNTRAKGLWTSIRRMLDEGEHDYRTDWSPVIGDTPLRLSGTGVSPAETENGTGAVACATLFDQFFNHPLISRLDETPTGKNSRLSHIPPTEFARALVDVLAPRNAQGEPSWDDIGSEIQKLPAPLRSQLEVLWAEADRNVERFRMAVESWFDSSMERVSTWYKKRTRYAMLGYGLIVAILFNVSAVIVTVDLYENEVVRDTVIGLAEKQIALSEATGEPCDTRDCLRDHVQTIADTGIPVFWRRCPPGSDSAGLCGFENGGRIAATIVGWLVTAAALSMGAAFWFALLKRAFQVRSKVTTASST